MRKNKLAIITLVLLSVGIAPTQAQQVILATGGEATGMGGSYAYSVGQLIYTTHTEATGSIEQGVQHGYQITTVLGFETSDIVLEAVVYPNPTTDYLILKIDFKQIESLSFQLFDINGRLLEFKKLSDRLTTISMENIRTSSYILKVYNDQTIVKTFRIIKN